MPLMQGRVPRSFQQVSDGGGVTHRTVHYNLKDTEPVGVDAVKRPNYTLDPGDNRKTNIFQKILLQQGRQNYQDQTGAAPGRV